MTVLDLTRLYPGPYAAQILRDLGARVIKVEEPQGGDPARAVEPSVDGEGHVFAWTNRGKESLAVNLKTPAGRQVLLDWAARAQVLVESSRPGVLESLGLGPEALRSRNRNLCVCSLLAYGAEGPLRDQPGHDINAEGLAGILPLTGPQPGFPPVQVADVTAALYVVIAILANLRQRRGGVLRISMADAALAANGLWLARARGGEPPRWGEAELLGGFAGYGVYRTSDGRWISLGFLEPKYWTQFLDRIGQRVDDAAADARSAGADRNGPLSRERVAAIMATRPVGEWLDLLRGLPVAEVRDVATAADHPQFALRGHDGRPGGPLGLSRSSPAPSLGRDTDRLLREVGYDEARIGALRKEGVIR
ncbi:MAG: CaiB/BaiF CoA transferase family protein [Thermoplasmatota archaeon]